MTRRELRRAEQEGGGHADGLFGRDLLFPLVLAIPLAVSTVLSPLLTRLLGPAGYGVVATVLSVNQLVVGFAALGMDQAVLVQRATDATSRAARGLVSVAIVLTSVVTLGILGTARWWGPAFGFDPASSVVPEAVVWSGLATATLVVGNLLMAERRLGAFSLLSLTSAVGAQVVGIVLVVLGQRSASTYVRGLMITSAVAFLIAIVLARPRVAGLLDWSTARRALFLGLPLAVNNVAGYVLNAGDRVLIQRALGSNEVGRYQVAYTIGYVVVLMLYYLSPTWMARAAAVRDVRERLAMHAVGRDGLFRVLVPTVLGIALAAPVAVRLLSPPSFGHATLSVVVAVVAVSAFPVASGGAITRELVALRRGRPIAVATSVSAVLNVVLNLVLLPLVGILGAAVATLISFAVQALLKYLFLPDRGQWPAPPRRLSLSVLAAAVAAVAVTLVPDTVVTMAVRFALGLVCLPWLAIEFRRMRRHVSPPPRPEEHAA